MTDQAAQLKIPIDQLPDPLAVPTIASLQTGPINATVRPPGSKSITNRALVIAALADGTSTLHSPLTEADDAQRMIAAIKQLGATVTETERRLEIKGTAGRWPRTDALNLNLNNAGTATRFLAASAILASAPITIDGNARMRERPIADLVSALAQLGIHATYTMKQGYPPVTLEPPTSLPTSPTISFSKLQSSQFVSALMLAAPHLPQGLIIEFDQTPPSAPYIDMTAALLRSAGAKVDQSDDRSTIRVHHAPPPPLDLDIEPDASGATYFWTAAAISPGATVTVDGIGTDSIQGDAHYVDLLERMGATVQRSPNATTVTGPAQLQPINADLEDMPDTAMSLAVACCFATGQSTITGLRTLRVKETDRVAAIHNELTKVGVDVTVGSETDPDKLTINPGAFRAQLANQIADPHADLHPVAFDTYDDHRMAMSLALIALHRPNTSIKDPACVRKTYPGYFADIAAMLGA